MTERIEVGDLVQVIRSCCNYRLGAIFTVEEITTPASKGYPSAECDICRRTVALRNVTVALEDQQTPWPMSWLKRIPPPAELGVVDEKEDLKEPA